MLKNKRKLLSYGWQLISNRNFGLNPHLYESIETAPRLPSDILEVESEVQGQNKDQIILSPESIEGLARLISDPAYLEPLNRMGIRDPQIDFVTYYRTKHVPDNNKIVFANHWHFDSTVPVECVKLFYCPTPLDPDQGPMEYLDRQSSNELEKNGFFRGPELPKNMAIHTYNATNGACLLMKPFYCMHRAGIPAKNKQRQMLMLQINERKRNLTSQNLYKRQLLAKEPTLKDELIQKITIRPSE